MNTVDKFYTRERDKGFWPIHEGDVDVQLHITLKCMILPNKPIVTYTEWQLASYGYWSEYLWEDGNWSCDCNRQISFESNGGEEIEDDIGCGEEAYRVVVRNAKTMEVIYKEFDE